MRSETDGDEEGPPVRRIGTVLALLGLALARRRRAARRRRRRCERAAIVKAALDPSYVGCVYVRVSTAAPAWSAVAPISYATGRRNRSCEDRGKVFDGVSFLKRVRPGVWRVVAAGSDLQDNCPVPQLVRRDLFRFAGWGNCK